MGFVARPPWGRARSPLPQLALLPLVSVILLGANEVFGDLLLYKANDRNARPIRDPGRYERVTIPGDPQGRGGVYYVERVPTLRVKLEEIDRVLITKKPLVTSDEEQLKEISGAWSPDEIVVKEQKGEVFYTVTLLLKKEASMRLNNLRDAHGGGLIDVRLNDKRLAIIRLSGPQGAPGLSIHLLTNDKRWLQTVLSPVRNKIVWK